MNEDLNNKPKTNNIMFSFLIILFAIFVIAGSVGVYFAINNKTDDDKKNVSYSYVSHMRFGNNNENQLYYNDNLLLYNDNTFKYITTDWDGKSSTVATGNYTLNDYKITLNIEDSSVSDEKSCDFSIKENRITSACIPIYHDKYDEGSIVLFNERSNDFDKLKAAYSQYLYSLVGKVVSSEWEYSDFKTIDISAIFGCVGDIDKFICLVHNTMTFDNKINEESNQWLVPTYDKINDNTIERSRHIPFTIDSQGNFIVTGEYTSY